MWVLSQFHPTLRASKQRVDWPGERLERSPERVAVKGPGSSPLLLTYLYFVEPRLLVATPLGIPLPDDRFVRCIQNRESKLLGKWRSASLATKDSTKTFILLEPSIHIWGCSILFFVLQGNQKDYHNFGGSPHGRIFGAQKEHQKDDSHP